jgi:hypothetical protein
MDINFSHTEFYNFNQKIVETLLIINRQLKATEERI